MNRSLHAGTSGFSYEGWRGAFYPADLTPRRMLSHYSSRLPTVELNATFHRAPSEETVRTWQSQVPSDFRFAVKAPKRISHVSRLRDCGEPVERLQTALRPFGDQLACVLVQLPPNLPCDRERLATFLGVWGSAVPLAVEFRHPSWFEGNVLELLRDHGAALCLGDPERDERVPPFEATASFLFLRFRGARYTEAELADWVKRIDGLGQRPAYAYFKHETEGPEFAETLNRLAKELP